MGKEFNNIKKNIILTIFISLIKFKVIMRFLFISFFLFFSIISNAQNVRRDRESINEMIHRKANPSAPIVRELKEPVELKEQIESFITFLKNGNSYTKRRLYIINAYEYDTIRHDYCFSMSYIANSQEFYPGLFTHYFMIGDDAVVLNASNPNIESLFSTCNIKAIEKKDIGILINHLAPNNEGIRARYDPIGMVYCKKGENIKKTFYPVVVYMPSEARIAYPPRSLYEK